jgi:chemotaxis protein CheX
MKAEYVNAFLQAAAYTLVQFGETKVETGSIVAKDEPIPAFEVGIFLGLVGDLAGEVIFSMSNQTAKGLASRMMMGQPVEQLTALEHSALGEFGNIVVGQGATRLSGQGLRLNLSPPIVVVGKGVQVRTHKVKTIAVKILLSFGDIEVNVGLAPKAEQ